MVLVLAGSPRDGLFPIRLLAAGHLLSGSKLPFREVSGGWTFMEESGPCTTRASTLRLSVNARLGCVPAWSRRSKLLGEAATTLCWPGHMPP